MLRAFKMLEHNMQQQQQTVVKIEFLKGSSFSRDGRYNIAIRSLADIVFKMSCYTIFLGACCYRMITQRAKQTWGGKTHLQMDELSWMRSYRAMGVTTLIHCPSRPAERALICNGALAPIDPAGRLK